MITKFKMPEPVACVARDGFTVIYYAENKAAFETDLYTAEALRDVLEQAAQLAMHKADNGIVVSAAIRAMIGEIK